MLPKPIWCEDEKVLIVDQTKLPNVVEVMEITDAGMMWDAIKRLAVRGAPAIGLAGGFGVYLGIRQWAAREDCSENDFLTEVKGLAEYLDSARPTAVNLHWAVTRMHRKAVELVQQYGTEDLPRLVQGLLHEARKMLAEDIAACRAIGEYGADLLEQLPNLSSVLTHCNAGALATSMYGTALAPLYLLQERGLNLHVYSDETRPLMQGARLTAWELSQNGMDVTTICDNMAGAVMQKQLVQAVIVGADRIAANGDTANKIGTYSLAVLAKAHEIPFFVAAPMSTVDFTLQDGSQIPIEERPEEEVRFCGGVQTAANGARIYNPAFDVTPHAFITAIITEKGIVYPPFDENMMALQQGKVAANVVPQAVIRKLQQEVLAFAKRMTQDGLTAGSFGNISMLDREHDLLAITPSGRHYDQLEPYEICIVSSTGEMIPGIQNRYRPSSELPMHCAIYAARSDVGGIVHSHGVYSTAFAATEKALWPVISEMAMLAPNAIPLVPYSAPGSQKLARDTASALQQAEGCLLANHGAVTAADTLERAYDLSLLLENGAKTVLLSMQLGELRPIPQEDLQALYKKMKRYGR